MEQLQTAENKEFVGLLKKEFDKVKMNLDPYNWELLMQWDAKVARYKDPVYSFKVRDKEIRIDTHTKSLSQSDIPKFPCLNTRLGERFYNGVYKRMSLANSLMLLVCTRLKEPVRTPLECLQAKVGQNVPIAVFIM